MTNRVVQSPQARNSRDGAFPSWPDELPA